MSGRHTGRGAVLALLAAAAALPLVGNSFHLHVACMIGINLISAVGLNLLTGSAGLVSLGHAVFMGVGAYAVAWFANHLGLPFYLCLPLSGLLAAGVGMIAGLPSFRLKGMYLAFASLAAQFILGFVFNEWKPVTGGRSGVTLAPAQLGGLALATEREMYFLIAILAAAALVFARNLLRTRVGRAFVAMRDRDLAAEVLGVDLRRYKLLAFGVSSFYAGVAGGLMAYFFKVVAPGQFGFSLSLFFLTAIVGGRIGNCTGCHIRRYLHDDHSGGARLGRRAARSGCHGDAGAAAGSAVRPAHRGVSHRRAARPVRDLEQGKDWSSRTRRSRE